jgi:aspartyl/asparaginyl-tRNA synthetase
VIEKYEATICAKACNHGVFEEVAIGVGPGRFIMKILDLPNVREATYLPRDVKRLNP